jgi:glycosyltransferase involved in cell wall biosynthesis
MLSIVIPTRNAEHALAPTLAALVPGALAGTVGQVIIADCGSADGTLAIADAAGCTVVSATSNAGSLRAAATAARGRWLMFLRPGFVPEPHWTHAVERFIETVGADAVVHAATFARASGPATKRLAPREILGYVSALLRGRLDPAQGLLISKPAYETLGGHREEARDCEADLMRRIGRGRITILPCRGTPPSRGAIRGIG